jgi:hypothetical protein
MNKLERFFFLLLAVGCAVHSAHAQDTRLYISRLRWTLTIPGGYKISDTAAHIKDFDKEVKWKDQDISSFPNNKLFNIENSPTCFMGASLLPYDSAKDGQWNAFVAKGNLLTIKDVAVAPFTLDTVSVTEVIAGMAFNRMDITMRLQQQVLLRAIDLNRQFGDHALRISLSYTRQEDADKYMNILKTSVFAH